MKILNIFKVMSVLVCLSHISYGSQKSNDPLCEDQTRTSYVAQQNTKVQDTISPADQEISNLDYYVRNPARAFGIFLFTVVASPFAGCKAFYCAASGHEGSKELTKDERKSKYREAVIMILGAPFIAAGGAAIYLNSANTRHW
jgi:hypothetical protein